VNKIQHISQNATLNSTEMISVISGNIYGYIHNGNRAKRYRFSDYMSGGDIKDNGFLWSQGKQEPRTGEWTKVMINGRGLFTVKNPKTGENYYTRLGDFHIDAAGNLVSGEGYKVQGTPLAGAATRLQGPDPKQVGFKEINPNWADPFNNPYTNNAQNLQPPGKAVGEAEDINLALDRNNGRYLGRFEEIKVGEDGVLYGKDGNHVVSLYKLNIVDFNNLDGLKDVKDGVYFKSTDQSGLPTMGVETSVIGEALEKSNAWIKVEAHNLTDAQRYFQAASQIHKLADKISGTAIEMIQ
jgi:flagellar hook protein FlgE